VVGDVVNLASRVENLNKNYGTIRLLTAESYEEIKAEYVCRPVDQVMVKGREGATTLYELMGPRDQCGSTVLSKVNSAAAIYKLYCAGEFTGVIEAGRIHMQNFSGDSVVANFIQQAQDMVQHKPANWTGVRKMESK